MPASHIQFPSRADILRQSKAVRSESARLSYFLTGFQDFTNEFGDIIRDSPRLEIKIEDIRDFAIARRQSCLDEIARLERSTTAEDIIQNRQ